MANIHQFIVHNYSVYLANGLKYKLLYIVIAFTPLPLREILPILYGQYCHSMQVTIPTPDRDLVASGYSPNSDNFTLE